MHHRRDKIHLSGCTSIQTLFQNFDKSLWVMWGQKLSSRYMQEIQKTRDCSMSRSRWSILLTVCPQQDLLCPVRTKRTNCLAWIVIGRILPTLSCPEPSWILSSSKNENILTFSRCRLTVLCSGCVAEA